jgi:hypothetical protein
LDLYTAIVDGSAGDSVVKGAKNPYTSRNGHMFSFLDSDGAMALRLPDQLRDDFLARHESGPVVQYGSVMRGYVSVPDELLEGSAELTGWFDKSYDWIGTLDPKPTKK